MNLTPNAPINRFNFIRKTYEKQPWVAYDTLSVIFNTIGIDEPWRTIEDAIYATTPRETQKVVRGTVLDMFHAGQMIPGLPDPRWTNGGDYAPLVEYAWNLGPIKQHTEDDLRYDYRADAIFRLVDKQEFAEGAMREPHEADSIFPWVARELSKLSKHTISAIEKSIEEKLSLLDDYTDYKEGLWALRYSTNLFAQWARAKHVDIMKMSLAEVIEATKDHRYIGKVRQGKIVHRLAGGWTVQVLRGRRELEPEGKVLAHCAGTYVNRVEQGKNEIYSLRDPDGVPYVTMDWIPEAPPSTRPGRFAQVFGFDNSRIGAPEFKRYVLSAGQENEPPLTEAQVPVVVELIRTMVVEFIDKVKGGDGSGLVLAGANLKGRSLAGMNLANVNLTARDLAGADLTGANLSGANLTGANLTGADLRHADLRNAYLSNAVLRNANLGNANLSSAAMIGVDMIGAKYNAETIWPDELDSHELWHRGAVKA